jgi:peptidoglycan/xylan/chitin deacetylase (PgdA/CDA1 family)
VVYATELLRGQALPPGSLCLTYDDGPGATVGDGPGPRTLPLAAYLSDEGVRAAFFMTGRHVEEMPRAPAAVRALGHIVGNHTHSHPHLAQLVRAGGDAVPEVASTDALIADGSDGPVYFRPPYGEWSASVAEQLNSAPAPTAPHIGPVGWDIDATDWELWQDRVGAGEAADVYLQAIESAGRGIVLMHDSTADSDFIKQGNAAYATTRLLVPELRRRGYTFVGLDDVPLA